MQLELFLLNKFHATSFHPYMIHRKTQPWISIFDKHINAIKTIIMQQDHATSFQP
jgi:hypothetical protein